jgi:hypothetical protein
MCIYIVLVLPKNSGLVDIDQVLLTRDLSFKSFKNESLEKQLNANLFVRLAKNLCDCNTPLGKNFRETTATNVTLEKEIDRMRRKHWTQAKINRVIAQKAALDKIKSLAQREQETVLLQCWCDFIKTVLVQNSVKWMGLVLHPFDDTIETEIVQIADTVTVSRSEISHAYLSDLRNDIFYQFG